MYVIPDTGILPLDATQPSFFLTPVYKKC